MKVAKFGLVITLLFSFSVMAIAESKYSAQKAHTAEGELISIDKGVITILEDKHEFSLKIDESVPVHLGSKTISLKELVKGDKLKLEYRDDTTSQIWVGGPCKRHPELPQCH